MRVAIFSESYEPIVNGVSVSAATLRDALRMRHHEVEVFAGGYPGHTDSDRRVHRFPSRMTRFAPGYPIPVPHSRTAWDAFAAFNPDIVHTQTPFFLGIAGMKWAKRLNTPIISTNHTLYSQYCHYVPFVPEWFTRAVLVRWLRHYYNRCDAVIVPSHPVEKLLRSYGVSVPVDIIRTGVPPRQIEGRDEVRKTFGIPDGALLLLYVGRIAKEKNLELLLKAFQLVRYQHTAAHLMLVGSGPYEKMSVRQAQELGLTDSVQFVGMLDRSVVARVYCSADLFVFPSVTETQGLVMCEALACGLPCIAVRAPSTPEVVDDGVDGLLTDNSPQDFARVVSLVLSDPALRGRLSQGALRGAQRFTPEAMAERVVELYQRVIDARKGN